VVTDRLSLNKPTTDKSDRNRVKSVLTVFPPQNKKTTISGCEMPLCMLAFVVWPNLVKEKAPAKNTSTEPQKSS